VVRALAAALTPLGLIVSVKIRVLPTVEATVGFARMLEAAGCMCLTVHGRTKEQRGTKVGDADWTHIAAVKRAVGIPVVANGNVSTYEARDACLVCCSYFVVRTRWCACERRDATR
jgi:tRNA-dihydrouridine synthase 1